MTLRLAYLTAIAAAAFCLLIAPASATHVPCGETLTQSVTLDSDVQCGPGQPYGLIIAADDVLVRLNSFTIRAGLNGGTAGIYRDRSLDSVTGLRIKRGTIEGFDQAISVEADDSTVFRVTVPSSSLGYGIDVFGHRNNVLRNNVHVTEGGAGIHVTGDDAYMWGNVVTGLTTFGYAAVYALGERARVVYNQAQVCSDGEPGGGGVIGAHYTTTGALINRNRACVIDATFSGQSSTPGTRVTLNEAIGANSHETIGISVFDGAAIVGRNITRNHGDSGMYSWVDGDTLRNNQAFDNTLFGIVAQEGTIDGGGNVASGNGVQDCVNISCSSP